MQKYNYIFKEIMIYIHILEICVYIIQQMLQFRSKLYKIKCSIQNVFFIKFK